MFNQKAHESHTKVDFQINLIAICCEKRKWDLGYMLLKHVSVHEISQKIFTNMLEDYFIFTFTFIKPISSQISKIDYAVN